MSAVGSADIHITVLLLHTIHRDIVTQRHIKCVQNVRVIRSACSLSVLVAMCAAGLVLPVCFHLHLSSLNVRVQMLQFVTVLINPLAPNDHYSGRTAPPTSKRCFLYIYSTNRGTEYFKHFIYSPFFSLQNAVCFMILTYLLPVLFTFYIQGVLKFKKIIPAPKG